jgi:hypothetical protein
VAAGFVAEPMLWPLYNGFYKGPWFLWLAEVLVGLGIAVQVTVVWHRRSDHMRATQSA